MATQIVMPQLGESVVEGTVEKWLKAVGERVEAFEPLLEISTDKVVTEIPSPAAGILLEIRVGEGETVPKGALLGIVGEAESAGQPTGTQAPDVQKAAAAQHAPLPEPEAAPIPRGKNGGTAAPAWHVTPVVARMAAEHHLDLNTIPGSGRGGRVTKKDVESWLASQGQAPAAAQEAPEPWETTPGSGSLFRPTEELVAAKPEAAATAPPAPAPSSAATRTQEHARVQPPPAAPTPATDGELLTLTPMRRIIAERMVTSVQTAPHVTTVFEVDLSGVLAHRQANSASFEKQGVKLTLTAYFVAAAVEALRAMPIFNSEWRDDGIYIHHPIHIGIAVAVEDGLLTPVLRDAGERSLLGIARTVGDLAARARAKQLSGDDLRGGTFTITNHGVSGSLFATPIIQPPQAAILGVGALEQRVKVIDGMIAVRPCAYLSLTFDHRIADGATGDAFMQVVKTTLEGWKAG